MPAIISTTPHPGPPQPTMEERHKYWRDNAAIFVGHMKIMIAALQRDGKEQEATNLRVWALMPWEATIRDDDSGDLWPVCEVCGLPIKEPTEVVSSAEVDITAHKSCVGQ